MKKLFSIILPIYKNEENLPVTIPYIMERLPLFEEYNVELILVCDGSPDNSYEVMKQYQKQYPDFIKIANFAKNCGQRAAITCGMQMAKGEVIGVISADLQDPFELFVEMLGYWENGEKLIIAYRSDRKEKGIGAKCSNILHKFINRNINSNYPTGGFDFFVVDSNIAKAFINSDTKNNSLQLLLLDLVGKAKQIGYVRKEREIGQSGWNLKRKIDQALNIITVYSDKPFWMLGKTAFASGLLGVILLILSFVFLAKDKVVTLYFLLGGIGLFIIAVTLFVGAVLGIYAFKWMQNNTKNPRYIVTEMLDETKNKE